MLKSYIKIFTAGILMVSIFQLIHLHNNSLLDVIVESQLASQPVFQARVMPVRLTPEQQSYDEYDIRPYNTPAVPFNVDAEALSGNEHRDRPEEVNSSEKVLPL